MALLMGDTSGVRYVDLQRLVISFIPIRPRLLVLSYVCKRWRKLVLETLEKLPPRRYLEHAPTDSMPLLRLIELCPNIRSVPQTIESWPVVPNAPKLDHIGLDSPQLSDVQIEVLRRSSCLTSLSTEISLLPKLRERGVTLDSFPHLTTLILSGAFASAVDEWPRLSLPCLTEVNWCSTSDADDLILLKPDFSKLATLSFGAWEEPNGFLDFILSNALSFNRLTQLAVVFATESLRLDLTTAQGLLRTCTSLRTMRFCDDIQIEPAAQQLLAPYLAYFGERDIELLPLATPGLGSALSLPDKSISDYPHVLPYLSRMQKLLLSYAPKLDLSSAAGVTELYLALPQPVAIPEEILTKWRIPTLRSLQLVQSFGCYFGFSRTVLPLLRVLFSDPAPAIDDRFPFPCLTVLEVDICELEEELDPETLCGKHFADFLALLPGIAARGVQSLHVTQRLEAEAKILMQERSKYLWMDIDPGLVTVDE